MEDEFARQHLSLSDSEVYHFCSGSLPTRSSLTEFPTNYLKEGKHLQFRSYLGVDVTKKEIDMSIFPVYASESVKKDETIRYEVIGYIPLVFFVDTENPIDDLTKDQIIAIYSGETKNFKDVVLPM